VERNVSDDCARECLWVWKIGDIGSTMIASPLVFASRSALSADDCLIFLVLILDIRHVARLLSPDTRPVRRSLTNSSIYCMYHPQHHMDVYRMRSSTCPFPYCDPGYSTLIT